MLRDSLSILEGLLEQQTSLNPLEIMADTAGTSDLIFGLFWLLGYQFSPRIADIGSARFWRIEGEADYGPLNGLAHHRINSNLITTHWDDMVAFSVRATKTSSFVPEKQTELIDQDGHTYPVIICAVGRVTPDPTSDKWRPGDFLIRVEGITMDQALRSKRRLLRGTATLT